MARETQRCAYHHPASPAARPHATRLSGVNLPGSRQSHPLRLPNEYANPGLRKPAPPPPCYFSLVTRPLLWTRIVRTKTQSVKSRQRVRCRGNRPQRKKGHIQVRIEPFQLE